MIFHCVLEESVNGKFVLDIKSQMLKSLSALVGREIKLDDLDESVSGTITDETNKRGIKSFFNVPVVINGQPRLPNISSTQKDGLYREEEMTILYTIMNQASTAVVETENDPEPGKR